MIPNRTKEIKKIRIENSNPVIPIKDILGFKKINITRKKISFLKKILFWFSNNFFKLNIIIKLEKKLTIELKAMIDKIAYSLKTILKKEHISPNILLVTRVFCSSKL